MGRLMVLFVVMAESSHLQHTRGDTLRTSTSAAPKAGASPGEGGAPRGAFPARRAVPDVVGKAGLVQAVLNHRQLAQRLQAGAWGKKGV